MNRELNEAIQKLAGTFLKDYVSVIVCTVTAVNEEDHTCDCVPVSGAAKTELKGVLLSALPNDGWLLVPAIDSTVLVAITKNNEPFVLMVSDVQDVFLVASGTVKANDGSYGGLVKVQDLVEKINRLENAFNAHTHILTLTSGTGTAAVPANQVTPLTLKEDLENTKFTHGK